LMAPASTPKPVIAKLHDEVQKALKTSDVAGRMTAVGGEVTPGSTEMAAALIHSERLRYEKLVREANIKPD
jgi:tripartite-type tricarboxylate transporter receptor subunit TctC